MGIKNDFIEANLNILSRLFPDKDEKVIRNIIESKYKEKIKDPTIILDNNVTGECREIKLTTLSNWVSNEKPIISGNATFYMKSSDLQSPTANMLHSLKVGRKAIKKKMFSYPPNSDEYRRLDLEQLNTKIIMNAEYGASGTPTAAFYTKYSPAATTQMAQSMVTSAAAFFESYLGDNQKFYSINEWFDWINAVLSKDLDVDGFIYIPSEIEVIQRMRSLFANYNLNYTKIIEKFIRSGKADELVKIYYANNLKEFIRRHDNIQVLISNILIKLPNLVAAESISEIPSDKINEYPDTKSWNDYISKEMFLDPYNIPEIIKDDMDKLSEMITKYCYVDYITPDSIVKLNNHKRNTVLLVDTDSNVVNANLFCEFILDEIFNGCTFNRPRLYNDMICVNIIASILSTGISKMLKLYCKLHNFDKKNWDEIVMKNEFLFRIFFIMNKKKRYTASIVLREGHIMIPFKSEIKGMDFIKAGVSDEVSSKFTQMLKTHILFADEPDIHGLMCSLKKFEKEIYLSIKDGGTGYFKTQVYKDANAYKQTSSTDHAWQLQVFRAAAVWNELYPLEKIYSLDRIKILKLNVKSLSDIKIISNYKDICDKIESKIFNSNNPEIIKAGLKVIAIPSNIKKIPEWIIPLIDIDVTISDVMSSFRSVIDALNIEVVNFNTPNNKANLISPLISI